MPANADEQRRLRKLHRLGLLDSASNEAFDAITRIATRHFGVPISLISLVDGYRQWFKSRVGLDATETPREQAFCAYTIQSSDVMLVPDATKDPRFAANPLVVGDPNIRFYAGMPLLTPEGLALGSLCIIDRKPRQLTEEDQQVLRDLATLVMAQVQMLHTVEHVDPISGLPNRTQYLHDAEQAAPTLAAHSLVMVETIAPESISQQMQAFGLAFYEDVIRISADIVEQQIGALSRIYHVDTARFLFSLRDEADSEPGTVIERLIGSLRAPFSCRGIPIVLQACVGFVPNIPPSRSGADKLQMAIAAVSVARLKGNDWILYDAETDTAGRRATRLLAELPLALRQQPAALRLVYQPRVDLTTGLCTGAEALLRWTHEELGPIPPGEFMPLVERTSLIHAVTDWVIRTAFRQAGKWAKQGMALCISVNLSVENLLEEDLVTRLAHALQREGLTGDSVELEITEGALLHNSANALQRLREIEGLGIRLAIDDFGTGYSNLAYLHRLHAKVLKLDQSLIRALTEDNGARVMVKSTMALAHELGYRVVAEGVEDGVVLDLVAGWGCDEVQGFHIARPMEASGLAEWVSRWNAERPIRL